MWFFPPLRIVKIPSTKKNKGYNYSNNQKVPQKMQFTKKNKKKNNKIKI